MLSSFVIAFLPRSKSLLIWWLQSPFTVIFEPNKIDHCFYFFPFYLPWSDRTRCHDLIFFLMLSFKPAFSLSSFTLIKRLFSSSSLPAIRAASSAYLRLLIFLPAIFDSSNSVFHMMYSTRKLNKQGDNIQPCHTLLSILNQSIVPCPILTFSTGFSGEK